MTAVTIPEENSEPKMSMHLKMLKPERKKRGIEVATF
jgi:hypothetical protein